MSTLGMLIVLVLSLGFGWVAFAITHSAIVALVCMVVVLCVLLDFLFDYLLVLMHDIEDEDAED